MLQFLTHSTAKYTIAELAQMAIEGGCSWIQVTDSTDDGSTLKETVESLIPLCEENNTILIIDHDVELTKQTRVHGVHLAKHDMQPAEAREILGPHAIIGVDVESADEIISLKGIDIDYVVLNPFGKDLTVEKCRQIVMQAKTGGSELPISVRGNISIDDVEQLRSAGVNGIAIWEPIAESADPVDCTRKIISILNK